MRILLAEDSTLLREGLVSLLERLGHTITGTAADAPGLLRLVAGAHADGSMPDIVITDVRMPPGNRDDGLLAALDIRERHPGQPILVLSQYLADAYADRLLLSGDGGVGYLLKDRVGRIADFDRSLAMIAGGGTIIDPDVVRHLVGARVAQPVDALTPREREVLALMAEGLSNGDIRSRLTVTDAAVSKHIGNIFAKLHLAPTDENRRVRAVLAYLRS
ncbi:response regulator [Plantibacter sp. Mn2098]|uniref:response regulator transcription factor n=1 Tax=Plantibacter sp. Mn2098 TaxID=3395266 RepID=UPI003BD77530